MIVNVITRGMKKGVIACFVSCLIAFGVKGATVEGNGGQTQANSQTTKVSVSQPTGGTLASSVAMEAVQVDNTGSFVNFTEEDFLPFLSTGYSQGDCESDSVKVNRCNSDSARFINGKTLAVPVL